MAIEMKTMAVNNIAAPSAVQRMPSWRIIGGQAWRQMKYAEIACGAGGVFNG